MTDPFAELLSDLGGRWNLPLHPDSKNACTIGVGERFFIQMELDAHQENIWILALMPELPPGSFRDLVLQEALKINHSGDFLGVLGYYASRNQLALFQSYPLVQLNGEKLADLLTPFIAYGERWYDALSHGRSAP